MIEAAIFDMDGTLLDTLEDLKESTNYALRKFKFPERTKEEVRKFVGNGVEKLFDRAVPKTANDETKQICIEIFKQHYEQNMYNNTAPYNSILEILRELKLHGIKTGIVSNKFDKAVKILTKKYFSNLIDTAIGQAKDIPIKPAPQGVLKAMKEMKVKSAVYIGDSNVDIETAHNANLKCIAVTWGFRDKNTLKNADYIVDTPEELLQVLRSL